MGCFSSKHSLTPEENSHAVNHHRIDNEKVREQKEVERPEYESSRKALRSLLVNDARDFVVDKNGKRIKVESLRGKPVGLLFSAHAVPAAREFTRILFQTYSNLKTQNKSFEVVFISNDETIENWKQSVGEMEWLALPFEDHVTGDALGVKFEVRNIPTLILIDKEGNVSSREGMEVIQKFGSKAWPFSKESILSTSYSQTR